MIKKYSSVNNVQWMAQFVKNATNSKIDNSIRMIHYVFVKLIITRIQVNALFVINFNYVYSARLAILRTVPNVIQIRRDKAHL